VSTASTDAASAALGEYTRGPADVRTATIARVNALVGESEAELVCLLDARVRAQPGWFEPLSERLDGRDGRGVAEAVTPCVFDEEGCVVEGGTMVAGDGLWHPVGAGTDVRNASVQFARQVDGSPRLVLLARETFLRVGGLDETFTTFQAAVMDLCVRLGGGTVWYEPSARVAWAPEPLAVGHAERLEADRATLRDHHRAVLGERPVLEDLDRFPHRAAALRDAHALDRVLLIDDRVPHHDRGAGDPRMRQIVEEMIALWPHARITLLAADPADASRYAPALLDQGIEVVWPDDFDAWATTRLLHYSIVVVSRPANFRRFDAGLRRTQPQALRVYDVEALFFRRLDRMNAVIESETDRAALRELLRQDRSWEVTAAAEADAAWCVTAHEEAVLAAVAPTTPRFPVVYFAEANRGSPGFGSRNDVLFFGGFLAGAGSANEDAVLYVVDEIMPRIWKHDPQMKLHIVGADATPAVQSLDGELVDVVGYVTDPREWLDRTLVHLAPMRFGSGLKLRFVETMAAGQPLVTSTIGAEGLGLDDLTPMLVADDPEAQAALVSELITNRSRWEDAQRGVLDVAARQFSRRRFRSDLVEAMSHLGVAPPVRVDLP
jgi:glycosyltransferase involved in cell wall biosynthesis